MPSEDEDLPGTLQRSPEKAQRTYAKALDSAHDQYDSEDESGPSDERSKSGGPNASGRSAGGVDVEGHTKDELYERAKDLDVEGRSKMDKHELGQAIARKQD
jgi:hypothetical protein